MGPTRFSGRGRSAGACTERSRTVNLSTGLFYVPPGAVDLGVNPHICLQHGTPPSINHLLRICLGTVATSEDGVTLNLKELTTQKNLEHNVSSVRLQRSRPAMQQQPELPLGFIMVLESQPLV